MTKLARMVLTAGVALVALAGCSVTGKAQVATQLPNGESQFSDANGAPYAAGTVGFYVPGTLTPKTTWSDSGETTANANPLTLDSAGRALIFGQGDYREILKDVNGNTVWDQVVSSPLTGDSLGSFATVPWAIATGTVNAITATYSPSITSLSDGLILSFRASGANTSTTPTFSPNGLTAHTITKNGGSPVSVNDIPAALAEELVRYNAANARWELLNPAVPAGGGSSTGGAVYLGSGTSWSVPAGVTVLKSVELWGGGGGGQGGGESSTLNLYNGNGGGSGAYCELLNISVTPGVSLTYGIGASGTAGAGGVNSSTGGNGGPGGNTSITIGGTTYTAGGGGGGGAGDTGGTVSGCTVNLIGQQGGITFANNSLLGIGGSAPRGGVGGTGPATTGVTGGNPGGGGQGGEWTMSGTGYNGGAGGPGGILIQW